MPFGLIAGAKVALFFAFTNVSALFFGSFLQLVGSSVFADEFFFIVCSYSNEIILSPDGRGTLTAKRQAGRADSGKMDY